MRASVRAAQQKAAQASAPAVQKVAPGPRQPPKGAAAMKRTNVIDVYKTVRFGVFSQVVQGVAVFSWEFGGFVNNKQVGALSAEQIKFLNAAKKPTGYATAASAIEAAKAAIDKMPTTATVAAPSGAVTPPAKEVPGPQAKGLTKPLTPS
jgi:hypothetical protein